MLSYVKVKLALELNFAMRLGKRRSMSSVYRVKVSFGDLRIHFVSLVPTKSSK